MPRDAASEPDALTMWFTRQRKAWWKKWRWVVITVVSLLFALLLAAHVSLVFMVLHGNVQTASWFQSTSHLGLRLYMFSAVMEIGLFAVAVILGSAESKAAIPSAELALTKDRSEVYGRLASYARARLLFWILLLFIVPELLIVTPANLAKGAVNSTWGELLTNAIFLCSYGYFIVEFQAYTLRSTVHIRSFTWLLLVPILAWPIFGILEVALLFALAAIFDTQIVFPLTSTYQLWSAPFHIVVLITAAIFFAYSKRKPPKGFTGTYET